MRCSSLALAALFAAFLSRALALSEGTSAVQDVKKASGETKKGDASGKKHGKHHHHHHHGKHHHSKHHKHEAKAGAKAAVALHGKQPPAGMEKTPAGLQNTKPEFKTAHSSEDKIVEKMKALEEKLSKKKVLPKQGTILVNGPLPKDFDERFAQAVGKAVGVEPAKVKVKYTHPAPQGNGIVMVSFEAPPHVVHEVETEAADPDSKLATGTMHSFLVSKGDDEEESAPSSSESAVEATPVQEKGIDIDTAMPYGDLEPFGREDTAQELTEQSIQESDGMVDQLERAEVAEEKRAVFRALTRLRGAAITSFDGVARSQTGNIDEYNKIHKWRKTHPLHHLADEESDISKWAFPDNADF